ncbi:DUF6292 family protein [Streptomyces sp. NPDC051840]|uniref:DUF6292 family protein n=1 Tax=Streptomyces sp. NPDC051840 TaxID=3154752 RepID=UPI00343EE2A8
MAGTAGHGWMLIEADDRLSRLVMASCSRARGNGLRGSAGTTPPHSCSPHTRRWPDARRRAETVLRARHIAPYLTGVAAALQRAGWTASEAAPDVQFPDDAHVVAALVLDGDQAPAPALVWDERYGWRTAASRRHPITKGAVLPTEGDGVRYLTGGITPPPGDVVATLTPGE